MKKCVNSMVKLSKLPNIGKKVEQQLIEVGITSFEELRRIGSREAWLKIQSIDESACLHRLMALEGAIVGVMKKNLPENTKQELKDFYFAHKL